MDGISAWLRARAEDVGAILLGLMFAAFVLQIVFRYVLNLPLGWTLEACLTAWLWAVFWGSAFCLRNSDHVRFEILYAACTEPVRRVMAFVAAAAIGIAFAASLPGTIDYITFYKIKKSVTLGIRLDIVFSIYGVFALAVIARCAVACWQAATGRPFEDAPMAAIDGAGDRA
jgi:TRAP-type C4-dicarboxylate transport system permease small subunit